MNTPHTPGPWRVDTKSDGRHFDIESETPSRAVAKWRQENPKGKQDYFSEVTVCRLGILFNGSGKDFGPSCILEAEEAKANAYLIAASPKMFDALWSIAKADEISWDTDDTSELVEMIRKKAREVLKEACDKTPW